MQVIAHRMNSLALARQAVDLGCDFAEIDVWEKSPGAFEVTRAAADPGEELAAFLTLPIGLYVDAKGGDPGRLANQLGARERTVVWSPDDAFLDRTKLCMPQAVSAENLARVLAHTPRHVAFDHRDFTAELVALAKAAGALVFVDRLRENDNPWKWEEAQQMGADGIQTDRPRELLKWLGR